MYGSIAGNIFGTLYFIYFQLAGICLASALLKEEKTFTRLIVGSGTGSLMLHWIPALFAFFLDFTIAAHVAAAAAVIPAIIWSVKKESPCYKYSELADAIKNNYAFSLLFIMTFILWCYLLHTHIIPVDNTGNIYTGQSTYGDMSMHLSFISSIAQQGSFPPEYALFPGTKLAYPFLNASISSSIYIFGASLRWAYILPMLTAFIQVAGSVYLIAITVLGSKTKSLLSFVMYIFNGGMGFVYFIDWSRDSAFTFSDIFTGYYTTPTNLIDYNIRWVNIIADILLPQRASLFGYAMRFICIWLLHEAVWKDKDRYFYIAGIFAACMPMIHTHSFLTIALISASWLLLFLYRGTRKGNSNRWYGAYRLVTFVIAMCIIQYGAKVNILNSRHFMLIGIRGIAGCVVYGSCLLHRYIKLNGYKSLLKTWGVYLAICLIGALPQLLFWTFGQVSEGSFLRGHFNWGNLGDFYPWFYIKNIGAPLLLIIGAICTGSRKSSHIILPAGVIWFIAELILFTPNTYDNNKLLYIAYLLLCIAAADYAGDLYHWLSKIKGHRRIAAGFVFLSVFSAVLTLGREAVSRYQLFSYNHLQLAEYIEENIPPDAIIMTNNRHNNEVVSLTGRNIVCGSDIYLYFHGIDTTERKEHLKLMYEKPAQSSALFEKYNVDYVLISSWEKANYAVNMEYFENHRKNIFNSGDVTLYKIR